MNGGAFGELRRSLNDDAMAVQPIPSLGVFLYGMESERDSPLTEDDVHALLEIAPAIVMTVEDRDQFVALRGPLGQLDPDNIWEEWLEFRKIVKASEA